MLYVNIFILSSLLWSVVTSHTGEHSLFHNKEGSTFVTSYSNNVSLVQYYLWTRSNIGDDDFYTLVPEDVNSIASAPFNKDHPTYVFVHGFNNWGRSQWIIDSKNELLDRMDGNIISIDWGKLANSPNYIAAVSHVYTVSNRSAYLIDQLVVHEGANTQDIHIIGWSLGAHTAGVTAKYVTSGHIGRVTGLDPAGPMFHNVTHRDRLDKTDAEFVDIIHTNSGDFLEGCFGLYDDIGHVDFYVNGGSHQPGCIPQIIHNFTIVDIISDCSHARAPAYWLESIRTDNVSMKPFTAWPCDSWEDYTDGKCMDCGEECLNMGFYLSSSARGKYYLRTRDESPYSLGSDQGNNAS